MIDLDALEQYAPGQIIPFPSDRLREIAAEVRNCREAWAQMARAKERESERAAWAEKAMDLAARLVTNILSGHPTTDPNDLFVVEFRKACDGYRNAVYKAGELANGGSR